MSNQVDLCSAFHYVSLVLDGRIKPEQIKGADDKSKLIMCLQYFNEEADRQVQQAEDTNKKCERLIEILQSLEK